MRLTTWKRSIIGSLLTGAVLLPATFVFAQTVTVTPQDSLWKLAQKYGVTIEQLKIANHLADDEIVDGSTLYIPPTSIVYEIQPPDSLWKLANRFKTTVSKIKEINQLDSDMLIDGEKLLIPVPASAIYTVKKGDILWSIANANKISVDLLMAFNQLKNTNIDVGQKLIIPWDAQSRSTAGTTNSGTDDNSANTTAEKSTAGTSDKPWVDYKNYTVKSSDTLWNISIAQGIPMEELLQANNMSESTVLYGGEVLKIPVHHIPLTQTPAAKYGEYLDWFEAAQYLFPIGKVADVTDFETGVSFKVKRTIGASHSDTEPLTSADAATIKKIWGGTYSWAVRPVIVEVDGRKIAASMASMPHSIEYITDNDFNGHFDIHFLNSRRHADDKLDPDHQAAIKIAAGVN
ncbi:LysM peptidoglycan-binding domain-containing protein [Brevibacillus fulvus]|uniref:LysM repeat protein n=1 Tax=Brevibacillus fulvus TaxID=1125967 RepID=A0A938XZX4_9BACL|nr:LysM peptidoglycan-binding domain-containing protein [Brevibacillus fulvus]MBM7590831.1 LysM repeat protein [Brevibacillus fulvus]